MIISNSRCQKCQPVELNTEDRPLCLLLITAEKHQIFYRKQIARNKKRNFSIIELVKSDVRDDVKVVVLLRGLPGSGKSTRADELVKSFRELQANPVVFSADKYFDTQGGYRYDAKEVGAAHNWAFKNTEEAVRVFQSPIIIDNTNTEEFEILNYYNIAYHNWYKFYVLEPDTDWAFDVAELTRRNTHGVPADKLSRMLKRYCWPRRQKWTQCEARPDSVSGDSVDSCTDKLHDSSIS